MTAFTDPTPQVSVAIFIGKSATSKSSAFILKERVIIEVEFRFPAVNGVGN